MTNEYTTSELVKSRVGSVNLPSDILDSDIQQWIRESSNFIDLSARRIGQGFQATEYIYPTVQQIATDLSAIKLLLRMSGPGKATTAGISYRIGEFSVDKKNIDSSAIDEIEIFENHAKESLAALKNYLGVDAGGFVGGSVVKGCPAPTTNYGGNSPQQP
ncbi:hypothetical protein C4573_06370 [Candidatus Woesearchaeota archaeon]|nr:MAG: hypothetical protein C4573_06370 [Candidatus Woesearchaeota archaeon]